MLRRQGKRYVLVNSDMKIPHYISKFLSFRPNKKRSFETILQSITDEKEKLGSCVIYFSSTETCARMPSTIASLFETLKSDHEAPDLKLVVLVANLNIATNKTVLVRSSLGDIDIICLFLPTTFHFKFLLIMEQKQVGKLL